MLLFRSEETVDQWCAAHNIPRRPLVNLQQLWQLAVHWYANRLTVESRRPAPDEERLPEQTTPMSLSTPFVIVALLALLTLGAAAQTPDSDGVPAPSNVRSRSVSILAEMPATRRLSSPNRCGPWVLRL